MRPEIIDALVAAGVTAEQLAAAIKADHAVESAKLEEKRARAAAKKRRQRANVPVCPGDSEGQGGTDGDPSFPPSSPTPPPSTNLSKLPPIVPQKAAARRASKASATADLAEQVWQAASSVSRGRSGRDKVRPAVAAAVAAGATPEALLASVRATCREAGQFAKGLHQIVNGEHWRDHGPAPPRAVAPVVSPEVHQQRLLHLKETNEWRESWGPRPERSAA